MREQILRLWKEEESQKRTGRNVDVAVLSDCTQFFVNFQKFGSKICPTISEERTHRGIGSLNEASLLAGLWRHGLKQQTSQTFDEVENPNEGRRSERLKKIIGLHLSHPTYSTCVSLLLQLYSTFVLFWPRTFCPRQLSYQSKSTGFSSFGIIKRRKEFFFFFMGQFLSQIMIQ